MKLWGARLLCVVASLSAQWACTEETDFDKLLLEGESLYAQEKQELIIRHFFRDQRDGFYVDIGCYLPMQASTTYYLEEHLGWSGIGVDAQERYRRPWARHRPSSKFFAYVVTDKSGETVTFHQSGPISSTEVENIEMWEKIRGRKYKVEAVELPTITIDDLLAREGVHTRTSSQNPA